jgi:SET domain-containing protein
MTPRPESMGVKTWRSPKLRVSDDTLAGRGVVAVADIARDEIVAIKAGHIVTRDEIEQVTEAAGDLALQIEDDFYLAPRSPADVDDMSVFINHSCDPNVGFRGQVVYVALRDIRAGEELCHDYAMERSDDYALDCHCGSTLCRGKVSGSDWKLPELQQRYRGYFSLYIENKIERG